MAAPTAQFVALCLLRDKGIYSLAPSDSQPNTIRPADLDDTGMCITAALQEAAEASGIEQLRVPGSGFIQAPASVTLNVTQGSSVIASFTGFQSWMLGCTIRFQGDPMDNEVLSATLLAHPFAGSTTTTAGATVYCDCFTLDETVEKIVGPIMLTDNRFCQEITSRPEFITRSGGFPLFPGNSNGYDYPGFNYAPFYALGPKARDQYPSSFFLDTYHDTTKDYIVRRVRLAPMPASPQSIVWDQKLNPIRVTAADITGGIQAVQFSSGTPSDANIEQVYNYAFDLSGYHGFQGATHTGYYCYFNLTQNGYIISNGVSPVSLPGEYWVAGLGTSPIGSYNAAGTATGDIMTVGSGTSAATDPGTKIRMPNGWVESILIPIARQIATSSPTFKNDGIRAEIGRQYAAAKERIKGAKITQKTTRARFT